jgi:hypothetical protein
MNGMTSQAAERPVYTSALAWFDEVKQAGMSFCDRHNVYSDSADASWFFNGLRNGFSDAIFNIHDR